MKNGLKFEVTLAKICSSSHDEDMCEGTGVNPVDSQLHVSEDSMLEVTVAAETDVRGVFTAQA